MTATNALKMNYAKETLLKKEFILLFKKRVYTAGCPNGSHWYAVQKTWKNPTFLSRTHSKLVGFSPQHLLIDN